MNFPHRFSVYDITGDIPHYSAALHDEGMARNFSENSLSLKISTDKLRSHLRDWHDVRHLWINLNQCLLIKRL